MSKKPGKTTHCDEVVMGSATPLPENGQEWLDIPGLPGYQAGSAGEIRNRHGRVLKQRPAGNGGRQISIGKATFMVQALIARAFYGKPPPGYKAIQVNGNLADNSADNLAFKESAEKCNLGHHLVRENVLLVGNRRGCLTCLLEVLDPGSPRWIEYFQSRKSECAPGPALPPSWLE